jgi:membrane-bound lytic murein transglycosylase B
MGGEAIARMPENELAMSLADVKQLQELLNSRGFASGEPDGRVGRQTRAAIRAYQKTQGLPEDGYASQVLLESLKN